MKRIIATLSRVLTLITVACIAACSGGGSGGGGSAGDGSGGGGGSSSTSPPTSLSYPSPAALLVDSEIEPLTPSVTGSVSSYSVDPPLPAGLALNPNTGVISGTPVSATEQAAYTITASNSAGSVKFELVLAVALPLVWDGGNWDQVVWQ